MGLKLNCRVFESGQEKVRCKFPYTSHRRAVCLSSPRWREFNHLLALPKLPEARECVRPTGSLPCILSGPPDSVDRFLQDLI